MKKIGLQYKSISPLQDGSIEIVVPTNKFGDVSILVDAEDLERVVKVGWSILKPRKVFYARGRCIENAGGVKRSSNLHQYVMNFPNGIIDHKNGNGLDNRKSNLRIATPSQSAANRSVFVDEKIQWKGVTYIEKKKLYCVQLAKDHKIMNFGLFKNPLLAAAKYNEMALKYHGEFARLNEFTEEQLREINNPPIENRRIGKNNLSGYMGVSIIKNQKLRKKYAATIYAEGRNVHLGCFMDAAEAAKAYNEAAIKYRGVHSLLNNI